MVRSRSAAIAAIALCASLVAADPAAAWDHRPHYYGPPPGYHHHDRGGDVALGVGLGVLGLGLTAAMLAPPAPRYYAPPPPVYYAPPPPPPVYYAPPPPPPVYYQPPAMAANPASESYFDEDGRQCREYQTTVRVGGRVRQAYGTACLEEDGTWRVER